MRYTPKILRGMLQMMIQKMKENPERNVKRPGQDFTRPRTLTFETVISLLLTMSKNSVGKILISRFQNSEKTPSASNVIIISPEKTPAPRFTNRLHFPLVNLHKARDRKQRGHTAFACLRRSYFRILSVALAIFPAVS